MHLYKKQANSVMRAYEFKSWDQLYPEEEVPCCDDVTLMWKGVVCESWVTKSNFFLITNSWFLNLLWLLVTIILDMPKVDFYLSLTSCILTTIDHWHFTTSSSSQVEVAFDSFKPEQEISMTFNDHKVC